MIYQNTLVKFGASWCNPCNQAEKFLSTKFKPHQYTSVDVTESEDIAKKYGIKNVPTFILFDPQGDIIDRFTGYNPKQIQEAISKIT